MFNEVKSWQVRSAGTEQNARIKVTEGHIGWADVIFVMEKKHKRRIEDKFGSVVRQKRVICLEIPDDYEFMDEELIELLESRVSDYFPLTEDY
ncbi:protein tyrosine phosphatase [Paenibacillus chitinolyticus]|uniref:Protein tyrosine phosphatase n=1 Tax=Paenibacillus chitinolyticus TaxID=79263 RepID=A0A410WZM1_9BACL|nr:protein-tyrosine-phosphatase [Paenibacillus chitinolyticus]MCY9590188.1 protein tyrosine phosphatase [Paenibacillus chitinolyticus]MCY9596884.1 protein tyrosine phosphatase [Paenibacillus chitinolyticus]QAV19800.1 protein tyrosine phosphatase [Paenibacillus chitinolyticus]